MDLARTALTVQWRLELEKQQIRQSHEEHLRGFAKALMLNGLSLIPSDILADNQVVVSRDVFEAAKLVIRDNEI